MCLNPYHMKYQTFDGSWRETDVPCGRCAECVRRAQSDLMILVSRQLESSRTDGNWFVTLSYRDDKLPLALTFSMYEDTRLHDSSFADVPPIGLFHDPYYQDELLKSFDYQRDGLLLQRSKPVRLARSPLKTFSKFDEIASSLDDWKPTRSSLAAREAAVLEEYSRRYRWNGFNKKLRNCVKPGAVMELSRRWFTNEDGEPIIIIATVTTSVDRQDPQLWLKSSRVAYERKFGRKLPDFSYTIVQEYGPRGHRPHYHAIFTDLPQSDLVWILSRWCEEFCEDPIPRMKHGSGVVYDRIKRFTVDSKGESTGRNGYASAGMYLGAYFKKLDDVQEPTMVAGLAVRPRRCSSIGFGIGKDFDALRSLLLAFDEFGVYDPSDLSCVDAQHVLEVVDRRKVYKLSLDSGKEPILLALPNYLRNKIYKNVKTKTSMRKKILPFTSASFDSYCEGSGFVHRPYHYEPVTVSYPCASELSQGLADLQAFRAELLHQEAYNAFVRDTLCTDVGDLPLSDSEMVLSFADYEARARRKVSADMSADLRKKYVRSCF